MERVMSDMLWEVVVGGAVLLDQLHVPQLGGVVELPGHVVVYFIRIFQRHVVGSCSWWG